MAVKIVLGFVLKMAVYWPWLARDLFFCPSLEKSSLKRQERYLLLNVLDLYLGAFFPTMFFFHPSSVQVDAVSFVGYL